MRVALFTNNYLPFCGGVTISVETLRRGLEVSGHEAWVFAPRFPGALPGCPARGALSLAARGDLSGVCPGHPVLAPHCPVRAGSRGGRPPRPSPIPARPRRGATGPADSGRPIVFTYHTRYEKYAHYVPLSRRLVESAAIRLSTRFADRCDMVIAPSTLLRDELQARGVRAPIAVVPTGVDLRCFRPGDRAAARLTLGLPAAGALLLYVGRLDREKSVDRVLLAFDRVASTVADAHLLLVGQGTESVGLRALARSLGASPRIMFLGARPHDALGDCYRAADAFLFASETETQGLVLAEAAACGVPAVAVSAPGCEEVVRDGETGLLTKSDPTALADATIGLLLDEPRRRQMGRAARAVAEREFDARLQIERTVEAYAEARARRRARAR